MVSAEYLAGFMDGEGYVALGRIPRRLSHEFPLRVAVYNSNRWVLEEIQRTWGGTLSVSRLCEPRWKPQNALIWTNAAAAELLVQVMPYLRIKSRQAAALLRFHAHVRGCPRVRDTRGRLLSLSGEELGFREKCYASLKALNARGRQASDREYEGDEASEESPGKRSALSLEYLAGLVDGEGSLMLTKSKPKAS